MNRFGGRKDMKDMNDKRALERAKAFNALSNLEIAQGELYTYQKYLVKEDSPEGIKAKRWLVFWQNVVALLEKK